MRMRELMTVVENTAERIVGPALRLRGKVHTLPQPARHDDVYEDMKQQGVARAQIMAAQQGFMTSKGRFVSRDDALQIAMDAGQLLRQPIGGVLTTTDMW